MWSTSIGFLWRSTRRLLALVGLGMVVGIATASAATVNLAWDANTEPDLAGYKLYQGQSCAGIVAGGTPVQILGLVTTTAVTSLVDGSYAWKLTAFDTVGNESGFSNCVTFQVDTQAPAAPGNLRVLGVVK